MNLGGAIKHIRNQKKMKQNLLAKKSGISQTYLSQIENNQKEPNISTLKEISKYLSVPLPVLFFMAMEKEDILPDKREAFELLFPSINSMLLQFFGQEMEFK